MSLFSELVPAISERILSAAGDFSALEVICCTEHSFVAGKARRTMTFTLSTAHSRSQNKALRYIYYSEVFFAPQTTLIAAVGFVINGRLVRSDVVWETARTNISE